MNFSDMPVLPISDGHDPQGELVISRKILERLRVSDSVRISNNAWVEQDFDIDFNMSRINFEALITSDHVAEDNYSDTVYFSFPSSPWQFFKSKHNDSWWFKCLVWGRRRDVKYTTHSRVAHVKVDRYLNHPDHIVPDDRLGRPVIFEQVRFK